MKKVKEFVRRSAKKGHEAYSCDLQPCSGGHPEWHIIQDVIPLLDGEQWGEIL